MGANDVRYRLISALLQAGGPATLAELRESCGLDEKALRAALAQLILENLVVEGEFVPGRPSPQYCWAARWAKETERRAAASRRELKAIVAAARPTRLETGSEPVLAFHDYVVNGYRPPKDKPFLVFFQCSVRRPFYSSPSHGTIRRAIQAATGCDAWHNFESCPVHVVVLASTIGPVPYELQDIYPANVSGGGVKHFRPEYYEQVKPVLARRMADYIVAHGARYRRTATFTEGRYGEVMAEAMRLAGVEFPILPVKGGAIITDMAGSKPRTYWQKYWIQLCLEIVSWLEPRQQAEAQARLKKLEVRYR